MVRVIVITNQKGGVGKTTTVINLAACLAEAEQRVLVVDFDPQGNTTSGFADMFELEDVKTSYDLICGNAEIRDCIIKGEDENLDLIAADLNLSGAEAEFQELEDRAEKLRNALEPVKEEYDYILIDCPPSLNVLTLNALTAADSALIPIQCEYYALEGLGQILQTISIVRQQLNPELKVEGVVFTMYDQRTNLCQQVVESVKDNLKEHIFETLIPRNIKLAEAPSFGLPITRYEPQSRGADSYRMLAAELMSE